MVLLQSFQVVFLIQIIRKEDMFLFLEINFQKVVIILEIKQTKSISFKFIHIFRAISK